MKWSWQPQQPPIRNMSTLSEADALIAKWPRRAPEPTPTRPPARQRSGKENQFPFAGDGGSGLTEVWHLLPYKEQEILSLSIRQPESPGAKRTRTKEEQLKTGNCSATNGHEQQRFQPPLPSARSVLPLCELCENMKYGNAGKAKSEKLKVVPGTIKCNFSQEANAPEYTLLISGNNNKEPPLGAGGPCY